MDDSVDSDNPLGSCCQRLYDELNASFDYKYFFERDGMLAITAGYNEALENEQSGHWVRLFAHHCPFCGARIMPEAARRKN